MNSPRFPLVGFLSSSSLACLDQGEIPGIQPRKKLNFPIWRKQIDIFNFIVVVVGVGGREEGRKEEGRGRREGGEVVVPATPSEHSFAESIPFSHVNVGSRV